MAQVTIPYLPYTYVSTAAQNDNLVLPQAYRDKVLTLFAEVTTAGNVQICVGSACGDDSPVFTSDSTVPPMIFGGEYGEINIEADASDVEVNISVA